MNRKVWVESRQPLLEDVFCVEEAILRHELPDGSMSPPVRRLDFERGDSAAALIVHRERRVCVLAEQFRYPAYKKGSGWLLEAPAGIVEEGETPEETVRREILEEVGYQTGELLPVATFFPSPGGSSERIVLYCAIVGEADRIAEGGGNVPEEAIKVREVSLDDIDDHLMSGRIRDGKTVLALTWLALRLARGELLDHGGNGSA